VVRAPARHGRSLLERLYTSRFDLGDDSDSDGGISITEVEDFPFNAGYSEEAALQRAIDMSIAEASKARAAPPCIICEEALEKHVVTGACGHVVCHSCLKEWTVNALKSDSAVRCPGAGCQIMVEPAAIEVLSPAELAAAKYSNQRQVLATMGSVLIPRSEALKCPKCDTWITVAIDESSARCPNPVCKGQTVCRKCGQASHAGKNCSSAGEDAVSALVKRCPQCKAATVHYSDHGCHHINCAVCHADWCYCCGSTYPCINHCFSFCLGGSCKCPPCPTCKPGKRCQQCSGTCVNCRVRV
jgi:hypothetical protein